MQNLKESWLNIPEKTRKLIAILAGGTIVLALIALLVLNLGRNTDYSTLFTGLSQEEAQQVVNLLQDQGIDYRYNSNDGAIRVPEASVDQTRARLVSQGYPKSGFTYDMYLKNTGLLTTESDKEQITLYELQDRLGATIRLFEGVQDAKVTIVLQEPQRFVIDDNSGQEGSGSVVITMQNGSSLTAEKAKAVKNLISHSVKGVNFTNVRVFDAMTMLEVDGDIGDSGSGTGTDTISLTSMVENSIAANVRRVLEQLYGAGNVAVSVKGTLNMERLIQENTQYTVPEKIDNEDKTGLLQTEEVMNESTNAASQDAGGLVGADANADTPRYTNEDGTQQVNDSYSNGSAARLWLYNTLKEQRQVDPGVLEDTSVAVTILTSDQTVSDQQLLRLTANASGIPVDVMNDKITIVRYNPPAGEEAQPPVTQVVNLFDVIKATVPWQVLAAIGAAIVLLLLLIILLMLKRRKKKKAELVLGEGETLEGEEAGALPGGETELDENGQPKPRLDPTSEEIEDEFTKNEEILNLRMQRSLRLKQNISEFVDQNPQIAAKLIQSWLRGEEDLGDARRKQSK
ncbi:MAG: flagellar M-ring protein FliF [Lachnospiraceae bacterium]|nr:flagellar M-ring protein FliF [Lachnospiraceae bacterium]